MNMEYIMNWLAYFLKDIYTHVMDIILMDILMCTFQK